MKNKNLLKATADGAVEEVEASEEELREMSAANAAAPPPAESASAVTSDVDDVLDLISDPNETIVVQKEVEIGKKKKTVLIKRLSRRENDTLSNRKYRRDGGTGKLTPREDGDLTVLAWQLHLCVVKNVAGKGEKPVYLPRWTMEQLIGKPAKTDPKGNVIEAGTGGLLDNPSEEAESLIDQLQSHIWDVNQSQNPLLMAQALQSLGVL